LDRQSDPHSTDRRTKPRGCVSCVDGKVLSDGYVTHVYSLRDGLVTRMDIIN
jgi:hypothetical protein